MVAWSFGKAIRILGLVVAANLLGPVVWAQSGGAPNLAPIFQQDPNIGMSLGDTPRMMARRAKALNEMRQKSMVSDANKLLKLAMELNAIDKDGIGISPEARLKKLAEIEKLAKSVREKMSYSVSASPTPLGPFSVLQP